MNNRNKINYKKDYNRLDQLFKALTKHIISISKKLMIGKEDGVDSLKQNLFIGLALLSIFACGPLLLYGSYMFILNNMNRVAYIEIFSYLLLIFIVFLRCIKIDSRNFYIVTILYSFSVSLLINTGFQGAGLVCVIAIMFLAGIVLDGKRLFRFAISNIIVFSFITYLLLTGRLDGFEIEAYKGLWFINMMTTQVSGIGLMLLVHLIYIFLKKRNSDLKISNDMLKKSREKEKLYADIYRSSPIAVGIAYPNGDLGECNQQCAILLGFAIEEINSIKWNSEIATPKNWIKKEINNLSILTPENDIVNYEKESVNKNGDTIPIELTVKAKFKEDKSLDYYICFIHDISERKKIEERLYQLNFELERLVDDRTRELKKTSNRLELAAKAGRIGVWEWYGDDEKIKWDSEMCSLYNIEKENANLSFLLWFKMIHPYDRKPTYKKLKEALKESDEFSAEFRVIWKDKSIHYIKSLATIFRNSKGIPMRIVGVNWDVTEEKKMSQAILKEGKRLQLFLDNSPIAVVITTDGIVEYGNKLFVEKFGLDCGQEVFNSYVNFKDREKALKYLKTSNSLYDYRIKAYDKNGKTIELIMNYLKIDYNGKPSLLVWIVDITQIIEMEKQLLATEQAAESVIDFSPLPLLILNSDTYEVLKTNQAFLDYNEIDIVQKIDPLEIYANPEIDMPRIAGNFEQYGIIQNEEIEVKRIGSQKKSWVLFSMYPVVYKAIESLAITFMDISEKNEYQIQLAKAKDEALNAAVIAQEATKTKSEFLANMSHEIRTPINAIIGLNDLMFTTNLSKKQIDYTNKICSSSKLLLQIINDILDFSKMEAGKLNIEEKNFSVEAVLSKIKDSMSFKAYENKIELIFDVDETVPDMIISDPLRLEQVLLNLTSNAIKFTEKGSVIIKVSVIEDSDDLIALKFSVKDTGIGIKEEQLNKLFNPFTQADASTTRRYGGTGLGLVISKNLVEMLGGEIGVNSVYGVGSEFYFTIKAYKFNSNKHKNSYKIDIPKCFLDANILVVIDNNYTRNVFFKYLSQLGNEPKLLSCGEEAIDELHNNNYDLVIMDCKMRGLDGVESWHIIKNMLDKKAIPKVIMVTAYGTPDVINAVQSENVDVVLIKPVTQSKLFDAIISLSCNTINEEHVKDYNLVRSKILNKKVQGIKILLVEDNEINQQVAKEILELNGFEIDVADNGQMALDKLNICQNYDAVLMDLQMPVMDGYEATKHIRNNKIYKNIPIIALSADAQQGTEEAVLKAGMNDYITKPIDNNILYNKLLNFVEQRNSKKQKKGFTNMKEEISKLELVEILTSIDVEDGLNRINNNVDLYLKLLNKFRDKYFNFPDTILELIKNGSYDDAKREVHTLKGVSATIGANDLNIVIKELESIIKEDITNNESIIEYIEKIKCMLHGTIKEINYVLGILSLISHDVNITKI